MLTNKKKKPFDFQIDITMLVFYLIFVSVCMLPIVQFNANVVHGNIHKNGLLAIIK